MLQCMTTTLVIVFSQTSFETEKELLILQDEINATLKMDEVLYQHVGLLKEEYDEECNRFMALSKEAQKHYREHYWGEEGTTYLDMLVQDLTHQKSRVENNVKRVDELIIIRDEKEKDHATAKKAYHDALASRGGESVIEKWWRAQKLQYQQEQY